MHNYRKTKTSGVLYRLGLCVFVFLMLAASTAQADTRTYKQYTYDEAGNIIRIDTDVSSNPPVMNNLDPAIVRIGENFFITGQGTDLLGVEVTPADGSVIVRNVRSTSTEVTFEVFATNSAPLNQYALNFTTPLGSTSAEITIHPRLPVISVGPFPLVMTPVDQVTMEIRLLSADIFDHSITLAVSDPAVATVTPGTITIPAGETSATTPVVVNGVDFGKASLELTSATLRDAFVPVFVTAEFSPPIGLNTFYSPPLGVDLVPQPSPPVLTDLGPFHSQQLTVLKPPPVIPQDRNIGPVVSPSIGVTLGSYLGRITPDSVVVGTGPYTLSITGSGLGGVTEIQLIPPEGVALDPFSISGDGNTVIVPITVVMDAVPGMRQLVLKAGDAVIPIAHPWADRIHFAYGLPRVESITPTVVVRGAERVPFIMRGENLHRVEDLSVTPATGITVSNPPQANAAGTEVQFELAVPEDVPLGPRVITLTTDVGTTNPTSSAANTLTVVNGPVMSINPVSAPVLGVIVGEGVIPPGPAVGQIRASLLGVSFGAVVQAITPNAEQIGNSFTLAINGQGLDNVVGVAFQPDDGITLGPINVAADGRSVTVDVDIALDALQTVRRVVVVADDTTTIPPASPTAGQFLVTGFQPRIGSVTPHVIVRGAAPPAVLTLVGDFFDDAHTVRVEPADPGISVSAPVVNANGSSLTIEISVNTSVAAGERVLVVETPAGETTNVASAANTLRIVNEIVSVIDPVLALALGVVIEGGGSSGPPMNLVTHSPLVGLTLQQEPQPDVHNVSVEASHVGVTMGAVAHRVNPAVVSLGGEAVLTIEGFALHNVIAISFIPPAGITQTGSIGVSADGAQVTLPIAIAVDAATTVRELNVLTASEEVPFASPQADRLRIATTDPAIFSIQPIQGLQGTTVGLQVRGLNLNDATAVIASPADGITFGSAPSVNSEGTVLTVSMSLAADAAPGPRVITIVTPVGNTGLEATPSNTFSVLTAQ